MAKFIELFDAVDIVSNAALGVNRAVINRETGKILCSSEAAGIDEIGDADIDGELEKWTEIPHKNYLGLGRSLVFEFIEARLPAKFNYVEKIFQRRGAYSAFKDLLDSAGLLQAWYDFDEARTEEALRGWCRDNGVKLED